MLPDAVIARAVRILLCASTLALVFVATPRLGAQGAPQAGPAPAAPNYVLASQWTSQKVSKLVFDTSVTPRWLQTSDRFWYSYQTREGRRFYLVDPLKKAKTPLFDHAKMAAALTSITRIPYDAQNLPFTTVRFVKNDAAFEFDFQVPATANINTIKPREITTDQQSAARGGGSPDEDQVARDVEGPQGQRGAGRGGRGDAAAAPRNKTLYFEYDMATGRVALLEDYKVDPRPPRWASLSPTTRSCSSPATTICS